MDHPRSLSIFNFLLVRKFWWRKSDVPQDNYEKIFQTNNRHMKQYLEYLFISFDIEDVA